MADLTRANLYAWMSVRTLVTHPGRVTSRLKKALGDLFLLNPADLPADLQELYDKVCGRLDDIDNLSDEKGASVAEDIYDLAHTIHSRMNSQST